MDKIRVSCVSYLNSKPFLFGLTNHPINSKLELVLDHPKDCARKLISHQADIGLVPVASLRDIPNHQIISNKCIGSDGPVASVMLFSQVPVEDISEIFLDYQSMTSVQLCRILCKEHWNINPVFIQAEPGYENRIVGTTAGVIIGDRALELNKAYSYQYDLPEVWKSWTGLPFVFACWASNRILDEAFLEMFEESLQFGLNHMDDVISQVKKSHPKLANHVEAYYKEHLCFEMHEAHRRGLALFLSKL